MTYIMAVTLVSLLVAQHAEILTARRIVQEAAMDQDDTVTLLGGPYDGARVHDSCDEMVFSPAVDGDLVGTHWSAYVVDEFGDTARCVYCGASEDEAVNALTLAILERSWMGDRPM